MPDGVAFDADGNCYVAHYTPDRIDRILPDGTVETVVEDWEAVHLNAPTNIAFCGPDLEFVVAACVGEEFLAIADLGVRGSPLRRPRSMARSRSLDSPPIRSAPRWRTCAADSEELHGDRHEIDVHPDECAECRRMIEAGTGEAEYEHVRATSARPEWRSSVWNRIGGRRTKWFDRCPEDRRY